MEIKAFFANLKHQYPMSQSRENDCSAQNGDHNEYPSLSHFMNEH